MEITHCRGRKNLEKNRVKINNKSDLIDGNCVILLQDMYINP